MIKEIGVHRGITTAALMLAVISLAGCPVQDPVTPAGQVKFAADYAFLEDACGLPALEELYGFNFDQVYGMALGLTHEALRAGDVVAAKGFTTDAKIKEFSLVSLEDDLGFFPAYYSAPVISKTVLEQYPEIEEIMAEIAALLNNETMIQLNYMVDIEMLPPDVAAHSWLVQNGLISGDPPGQPDEDPVIVGLKESTEQIVLGYIAVTALQYASIPVMESVSLVGRKDYRSEMLKGKVHMYWEDTGIAWSDIYGEDEIVKDPDQVYAQIAEIDAEAGLIWLDYAPFSNNCAILMRREDSETLGITTLSELAAWSRQLQADTEKQ